MYLEKLLLQNFRNYSSLNIKLNPHVNIIYGNNAQGKTNLLESIYVLGLTKSHLLQLDNHLITTSKEFYKIKGIVKKNKIKTTYEVNCNLNKKILKIDGQEIKKISDYINNSLNIIIFYPEDLEIIKGSPNIRRNFLNLELSQLSNNYLKILNEFNKLLKIRNEYLKKMSKNQSYDKTYFNIITNYFVDKSLIIYKMRKKFVEKLNENCGKIFFEITKLSDFHIEYINNFINENSENQKKEMLEKLDKNIEKEIKFGSTLYGPHRDELEFFLGENNLKIYGSQGQKRMAVLSTKLAEIDIFKKFKNTNPILLLDDVFSELDDIKKNNIIKYLADDIQVIITTTDLKKINKKKFNSVNIFKIKNGEIIKTEEVEKDERKSL